MNNQSEIITKMTGMLYPFIILFGFYIILNGHNTPGGGFQGGAVLSAVFISRYIVLNVHDIELGIFKFLEKLFFTLILAVPLLYVFMEFNLSDSLNIPYLLIMNTLIGMKVCCGLSIVFFRFVFYESR